MKEYTRKFKKFFSNKLNVILVLLIIVFIAISFLFAKYVKNRAEALLVEQMQHREQLAARIAGKSIDNFFTLVDSSLLAFSINHHISHDDPDTSNLLNQFSDDFSGTPVIGIYFVNKDGIIHHEAVNIEGLSALGVDVSDRDYIVKSTTAEKGEIITGKPILARVPNHSLYIIPISTPIFVDGIYNGTLVAPVLIEKLAENYLLPAKISENTKVYLLDSNGVMLYAPYEDYIGKNYFDVSKASGIEGLEESERLLKLALVSRAEGKLDLELPGPNDEGELVLQRYILAHVPISHEDEEIIWTLGVGTPDIDVFEFFGPARNILAGGALLVMVTILTFATITTFAIKNAKKDVLVKKEVPVKKNDRGTRNNEKSPTKKVTPKQK